MSVRGSCKAPSEKFDAAFLAASAVVMFSLVLLKVIPGAQAGAFAAAGLLAVTMLATAYAFDGGFEQGRALFNAAAILSAAVFVPVLLTRDAPMWAAWLGDIGWSPVYVVVSLGAARRSLSKTGMVATAAVFAVLLVVSAYVL